MPKVEIYSSMLCGFCYRAKKLLKQKGVDFEEIEVTMNAGRKREMIQRAGGRTSVPQIFIDDHHVGGFDDLAECDMDGDLDKLLGLA